MLMKLIPRGGSYETSLRRRRLIAFGLLALGILGVCCYLLLLADSGALPDFARGFYLGASCGLALGGVVLLVRAQYLLDHPEERKKAKIKEQDERERAIQNQAFQFAGYFTFFACAAALLVTAAFDRAVSLALLCVLAAYAAAWLCAGLYLSKKL